MLYAMRACVLYYVMASVCIGGHGFGNVYDAEEVRCVVYLCWLPHAPLAACRDFIIQFAAHFFCTYFLSCFRTIHHGQNDRTDFNSGITRTTHTFIGGLVQCPPTEDGTDGRVEVVVR